MATKCKKCRREIKEETNNTLCKFCLDGLEKAEIDRARRLKYGGAL